jgi:hypothetical protein
MSPDCGLRHTLEDIFRTFPDWKMEIVEIASGEDSVIVRCRGAEPTEVSLRVRSMAGSWSAFSLQATLRGAAHSLVQRS